MTKIWFYQDGRNFCCYSHSRPRCEDAYFIFSYPYTFRDELFYARKAEEWFFECCKEFGFEVERLKPNYPFDPLLE